MNADLSALLLSRAKKLPAAPKPTVQRGRYSSNRHLYESAEPAIDIALKTGMNITETTTWLLAQFPRELLGPDDHGHKQPGWWRWYQFIRRRAIKLKAEKKTNTAP